MKTKRNCRKCGGELPPFARGNRRYCSIECAAEAQRAHVRAAKARKRGTRPPIPVAEDCAVCGAEIAPERRSKAVKTCGAEECDQLHGLRKARMEKNVVRRHKNCVECGKPFKELDHASLATCSEKCREARGRRVRSIWLEGRKALRERRNAW